MNKRLRVITALMGTFVFFTGLENYCTSIEQSKQADTAVKIKAPTYKVEAMVVLPPIPEIIQTTTVTTTSVVTTITSKENESSNVEKSIAEDGVFESEEQIAYQGPIYQDNNFVDVPPVCENLESYEYTPKVEDYDEQDIQWLAKIMDAEGRYAPRDTRRRIGAVVLNRMVSDYFEGNTVYQIISAPGQYSTFSNNMAEASPTTLKLARELYEEFTSSNWINYCRWLKITHKTVYQTNGYVSNAVIILDEYYNFHLKFGESIYDRADYAESQSIYWNEQKIIQRNLEDDAREEEKRLEQERLEKEKKEQERLEQEQFEKEKNEQGRLEQENTEPEILETEVTQIEILEQTELETSKCSETACVTDTENVSATTIPE